MINSVKEIKNVIDVGRKVITKTEEVVHTAVSDTVPLAQANGDLLKAYHGIKTKKLFADFSEFVESFKTKLESFKDDIPDELCKKLETKVANNDFSLTKTVSEYFSGLKNCKTLEDVRKLYPDMMLPNLKLEEQLAASIKGLVPKSICDEVSKLANTEEKLRFINNYFENRISKQVHGWEIYPEFKKIQDEVANQIVEGKFVGEVFEPGTYKYGNKKMPLIYRFMHTADREQAMITILKKSFIQKENLADIAVQTVDGKEIYAHRLRHHSPFSVMDDNFRTFLKNAESNAKQFAAITGLNKHEINSAIMTETWRSSGLRRDLGNETAYKKDWSILKQVWQKTMFPESTYNPTNKLIDVYLLNMFKNGKRNAEISNPLLKYTETPEMDKLKISFLKRLYGSIRHMDLDKSILNGSEYKKFKAQFDLEGMAKTIEGIEEHYKNAFFKGFWTDERKLRFTNALHENKELAGKNIELSDDILVDAMNLTCAQ